MSFILLKVGDTVITVGEVTSKSRISYPSQSVGVVSAVREDVDEVDVLMEYSGITDTFRPWTLTLVYQQSTSGAGVHWTRATTELDNIEFYASGALIKRQGLSGLDMAPAPCAHQWQPYTGLCKKYEFCLKCDEKRNERGLYD